MGKDTQIELLALKTLARTCKEKSIYPYIICSMCSSNKTIVGSIISTLRTYKKIRDINSNDNPFMNCKTQEEIISALFSIRHRSNTANTSKLKQFRVMDCVNNLIHSCLERTIKNGARVEDIGREAFENTCKKIFGDDFKDETGPTPSDVGNEGNFLELLERINHARGGTRGIDEPYNGFVRELIGNQFSIASQDMTENDEEEYDYDYDDDDLPF